jgi:hypothetical protein
VKNNIKKSGGSKMGYSKLSIVLCLTVCLTVLFAPFLLEISSDGKTYAFSSRSHNNKSNTKDKVRSFNGYTPPEGEDPANNNPGPAPVPEPASWLLIGAGAAGLAVLRKKYRKK